MFDLMVPLSKSPSVNTPPFKILSPQILPTKHNTSSPTTLVEMHGHHQSKIINSPSIKKMCLSSNLGSAFNKFDGPADEHDLVEPIVIGLYTDDDLYLDGGTERMIAEDVLFTTHRNIDSRINTLQRRAREKLKED